ncbi:MAG: hypothetical protein RIS64_3500, partial [Bacteroidota bacterium]
MDKPLNKAQQITPTYFGNNAKGAINT